MSRSPDSALNVKLPADTDKFGEQQRLIVEVPNPLTVMLNGRRWHADPPFGYDGFNFRTVKNLFIDITEQTLFQGRKNVTFQTPEIFTLYTTGKTVQYAKAHHDTTSITAVVVSQVPSSEEKRGADLKPLHGDPIPTVTSYVGDRDTLLDEQKALIESTDTKAADVNTSKTDLGQVAVTDPMKAVRENLQAIQQSVKSGSGSTTGATHAGISLVSKDPIGIFGSTNLVCWANGGISAIAGSNDSAKDFYAFATQHMILRAAATAELGAKDKVTVEAALAQVNGNEDAALCSRTTNASVLGKDVFIGALVAADRVAAFALDAASKQKDTDTVTIEAKQTIQLTSDDKIAAEGANKIELVVGSAKAEFTTSKIKLALSPAEITMESSKVEIKLGGSTVKLEAAGITLSSSGSELKLGPSGATLNGAQVKLG